MLSLTVSNFVLSDTVESPPGLPISHIGEQTSAAKWPPILEEPRQAIF